MRLAKPVQKYLDKILLIPKTGQSDSNGVTQHTLVLTGSSENSCFQCSFIPRKWERL